MFQGVIFGDPLSTAVTAIIFMVIVVFLWAFAVRRGALRGLLVSFSLVVLFGVLDYTGNMGFLYLEEYYGIIPMIVPLIFLVALFVSATAKKGSQI